MTINKRVTEVENTLGAILWKYYEALLQSKKDYPVDKHSTPFGKFYFPEEKLSTALERLAMGIREIRHNIIHGSQEKETINNIKLIAYQETIEHTKDCATRSERERQQLGLPKLFEEVHTLKVQMKQVTEEAHVILKGGEDVPSNL